MEFHQKVRKLLTVLQKGPETHSGVSCQWRVKQAEWWLHTVHGQVDVVHGQLELISPTDLSESVPILNSKSISTQRLWLV